MNSGNKNPGREKLLFRRVIVLLALLFLCILLVMPVSHASTKSEMLRTQAVLAMYDGKYQQALDLLTSAVFDDPEDYNAVYYRGIVLSRMGRYEEAIGLIELATKNSGDLEGLYFELGYAQYLGKNLTGAQLSLEQAQQRYPDHAPAKYYLGLTYYLQKRYRDCIKPLESAALLDHEFGASAAYLIGDAYVKTRRFKLAEKVLAKALEDYPDSVYNTSISKLLSDIGYRIKEARPWAADVIGGFAYDDNVGLFPDDASTQDGSKKSDTRTTLNMNAAWKLLKFDNNTVQAGLQLFSSRHASLSEYDIQKSSIALGLRNKGKRLSWGLRYELSKTNLDSKDYQETGTFIPNAVWVHNRSLFSLGTLIIKDTDYLLPAQEDRSNYNYQVLYRAYFLQGGKDQEKYFTGLQLERNNAIDADFDHNAWRLEAGYEKKAGKGSLSGSIGYGLRDYTDSATSRENKNASLQLKYNYPVNKDVLAAGGLTYINNPSSDKEFDYTRSVVSLLLRWTL